DLIVVFFFQAEDGIRGSSVTGVQTVLFRSLSLAGPVKMTQATFVFGPLTKVAWVIFTGPASDSALRRGSISSNRMRISSLARCRSEERRVGRECGRR